MEIIFRKQTFGNGLIKLNKLTLSIKIAGIDRSPTAIFNLPNSIAILFRGMIFASNLLKQRTKFQPVIKLRASTFKK